MLQTDEDVSAILDETAATALSNHICSRGIDEMESAEDGPGDH